MSKYIFVTGGVVSGIGKGITASSLGRLLIERGLKVSAVMLDPDMNVDINAINPAIHGEVFVTDDGGSAYVGLGHYERMMDLNLTSKSQVTMGKVYASIIGKESSGATKGASIQMVPHITSEIKAIIKSMANDDTDIVIVEVGGTVGDMECTPYLEAVRQFEKSLGVENYIHIHCTLAPYMESLGDIKTKPTQHSVRNLNALGLSPDIIICRTSKSVELSEQKKKKIAMYCNLTDSSRVIHTPDCDTVYEVPLVLFNQGLDRLVCTQLGLNGTACNLTKWKQMVDSFKSELPHVKIAIVGKYTENNDAYRSVIEALKCSAFKSKHSLKFEIISSEDIEVAGAKELLKGYDGVIVPGGFGSRGIEGMILTAQYCRENKIPYLGLSLGMQVAVIDFARNVAGLKNANSTEFELDCADPVIDKIHTQVFEASPNAIRLGSYQCNLADGSKARTLYGMPIVKERHRNAYEFNKVYKDRFVELGMVVSGENPETGLVEIVEYSDHPFFIGTEFLPEYTSRPNRPHALFVGFVASAIANSKKPTLG